MRETEGEVTAGARRADQGDAASSRGNSLCEVVEAKGNRAGTESARRNVLSREATEDSDCSYLEGVTIWGTQVEEEAKSQG